MRVIGFTGLMGSGKNEAANALIARGWRHTAFAEPLKAMLRTMYRYARVSEDLITRKLEGDLKNQPCKVFGGKTPRYAMQTLGTEWGRDLITPTFWCDLWLNHLDTFGASHVVVSDVRFFTEVDALRQVQGTLVRIERPGVLATGHASERDIQRLPADFELYNTGSIFDLHQSVLNLVNN